LCPLRSLLFFFLRCAGIEDLRDKREEINRQILKEDEEKAKARARRAFMPPRVTRAQPHLRLALSRARAAHRSGCQRAAALPPRCRAADARAACLRRRVAHLSLQAARCRATLARARPGTATHTPFRPMRARTHASFSHRLHLFPATDPERPCGAHQAPVPPQRLHRAQGTSLTHAYAHARSVNACAMK
jgi:hypothetical protein